MFNRWMTCLGVIAMLTAGAGAADKDDAAERKKLVGTWVGGVYDGRGDNPGQVRIKLTLTITEKAIHGIETKGGNAVDHGTGEYAFDFTADPQHLDAWKTNQWNRKEEYQGIYKLEGDTLKWCVSPPRKGRPKGFESGNGCFLVIVKKEK